MRKRLNGLFDIPERDTSNAWVLAEQKRFNQRLIRSQNKDFCRFAALNVPLSIRINDKVSVRCDASIL